VVVPICYKGKIVARQRVDMVVDDRVIVDSIKKTTKDDM
jgi:hypothetical protein